MKHIYKYLIALLLLFTSTFVMAQNQVVTGIVTDEGGGVAGASVKEKGLQSNGVSTDNNGKFSITLKGNSKTLIVSYIGMLTQEVEVGSKTSVNIRLLEDAKGLDQVVVVGYGKQKKITLTGSISTVSGAEIRQNPSASLQNTLVGRLPGFFSQQRSGAPGADGATFFIRGVSSYNGGSTTPLIIVDDIEYSPEQFAAIDANEVENISILKDAATTAIYGIKGANGVLVVTTRRGKVGPPQITYRNEFSVMKPTVMPEFLDSYETAVLYNKARANDGLPVRFTADDLQKYKDGSDPYGHPNNDWKDILFKDYSKQAKGNFDITGGTEKVKYFVSAGFLFQDGMLKNYGKDQGVNSNFYYTRYNYRSNLDIKATKTLDLRVDLYGNLGVTNTNNIGSAFGYNDIFYDYVSFLSLAPFNYPVYNPDGSYGYSKWQRDENPNYNQNNIVGRITHYGYNRRYGNNMNLVANATQKLDFLTEGLSLKGVLSYASTYDYTRSMTRDQFPSFIYDPTAKAYEPRDPNIYRVRRYFIGYGSGNTIRNLTTQIILNYDRSIGNHHFYGTALTNLNSVIRFNSNAVYNFVPNNFKGYTGRVGYDYADKYLFQFNAGYNGSDRFVSGKKYGFFPAASAGWVISNEKFWKDNVKVIDYLKFRGSYGIVGNDRIGDNFSYSYQQNYNNGNGASFGYSDNTQTGFVEGTLANNNVTWEKEKKADVAMEFGLFKSKLTGSVDLFYNVRSDILTTRGTVSSIFGVGLPPVNLGEVENKGGEIELNYKDQIGNVTFGVRANYSLAKNKIIYQDEPNAAYPYQAFTGNSIGQILTYKFIGFYTSAADIAASPKTPIAPRIGDLKYEDMNGDGKIDTYDQSINGFPNLPNSNYGLELRAGYKGFGISLLFQAATNFNVRGVAEAIQAFSSNLTEVHQNSWTPELGDNAQYPLLSFTPGLSSPAAYPSTFWFVSGNYLRLKNAEINYSFGKTITQKLNVQNLRAYVNGYNLVTWSNLNKRYQFDPESNSGADRIKYPPQQMINLGLSVTF
ncbi:TonB-dependent receptor [Pedobacter frigiditerrae]|uniref:SusC/RagA family TonB-linked outer membrane protein n=1 Tax=Pedobacter frigiditerrae TaxID=2530452 RepID=UPI002931482B|nr:TonB-dependent receptor [Pedobacter frigiditerrae]